MPMTAAPPSPAPALSRRTITPKLLARTRSAALSPTMRGHCPRRPKGAVSPGGLKAAIRSRGVMRYVNGFSCVFLALFTIVQYNEPDAILWVLIYGLPTIWAGFAAYR